MTTQSAETHQDAAREMHAELDRLYPGALALLLLPLCRPSPHEHRGAECNHVGKVPVEGGWNAAALARFSAGTWRDERLREIAHHLAGGGNVGWAVPLGVVVLDADTHEAAAALLAAVPEAPFQRTSKGAHVVLAVPPEITLMAETDIEIAAGLVVDVRAAGKSQIAVEPSIHFSGDLYTWGTPLPDDLSELPACPAGILERLPRARSERECGARTGSDADEKIRPGDRNETLFKTSCRLRGQGWEFAELLAELLRVNARRCEPSLSEAEVETIVRSACRYAPGAGGQRDQKPPAHTDAEAASDSTPAAQDPGRFFTSGGLVVPLLGEAVRELGNVQLGVDGRLYRYSSGVYRADGDAFVRSSCRRLLGDVFKRRHVDEVVAYFRAEFASITDRQPEDFINLRSGLLLWGGERIELRTHSAEIVSTIQIPHAWNPAARCPQIEKFLTEVLPEDAIEFVLDLIGYALLSANPLRVAVLLLGPGRNGKSVLLAVILRLLGPENVSAIPLQALTEHRFAPAELFGKLANICGDLDARAVRQSDTFKMLTGGDPMIAERKYRDPFMFRPFALPIFSANEPPLSSDQTEAWFDRWLIVPMERRITEDQIDPHLIAKLTTQSELEGLLMLAVEGLRRVMARGRFELPSSVVSARSQYRERLDSVAGFLAEECELHGEAWTPRPQLYKAYRNWAMDGGRLPVSVATFNDHVRRACAGKAEERPRRGVRGWAGIWLREGALDA